ncbi:MAG: hypothetical protein KGN78_02370 [Actinomycetales bacterium]|nr:hypothetical protein [Actinomycetales bacterium]
MAEIGSSGPSRVGPVVTTVVAAFVIGLATGFVIKLVLPRHSARNETG